MHGPWLSGALALVLAACGEPRGTAFWVADRGAGEVLALDGELCVLARFPDLAPRLIGARPDGVWVAGAPAGGARRAQRLVQLDARSGVAGAADFAGLVALDTDGEGAAYVLERGAGPTDGETLLWRVDAPRLRTLLGSFQRARALAVQPGGLLIGCASGALVALRPDGAVLVLGQTAGPVHALARGPRAGEWWALDGTDGTSLRLLDRALAPVWSTHVARGTRAFAALADEERVWVAEEGRVRRHGPAGAVEVELELPGGPWQAALATRSGVLLASPGALLEVEVRHGQARIRRTQGGFAALSALVSCLPITSNISGPSRRQHRCASSECSSANTRRRRA